MTAGPDAISQLVKHNPADAGPPMARPDKHQRSDDKLSHTAIGDLSRTSAGRSSERPPRERQTDNIWSLDCNLIVRGFVGYREDLLHPTTRHGSRSAILDFA